MSGYKDEQPQSVIQNREDGQPSSSDVSDCTNYSDPDYVPDSNGSSDESSHSISLSLSEGLATFPQLAPAGKKIKFASPSEDTSPDCTVTMKPASDQKAVSTPQVSHSPHSETSYEEDTAIKVLPPSNLKTCRIYDKKNYCLFCSKATAKIARHLVTVHKNKAEVAKLCLYPKNSRQRQNMLSKLRNQGNFAHNQAVVREGQGDLAVRYRPKNTRQGKDFIHCLYCQGLYAKKTLWKHVKTCPERAKSDNESELGRKRVRSLCALASPLYVNITDGLRNILSHMTYDDVSRTAQSDVYIVQFGQHLFNRHGSDVTKHDYIRQKMREVARLLLEARKKTHLTKLEDFFIPSNFPHVVSAVQVVAGYDSQNNTYSIPSLALKLGHSLNKICSIAESNALMCGDQSVAQSARNFRILYQTRWNELISAGALTTLKEAKWNTPQRLPFTQDVKLLNFHIDKIHLHAEAELRQCPSSDNYAILAKVILARTIIFNRRRAGEVSKMELVAFTSHNKSELHDDMAICLSDLERKMCQFFTRVEIRGKRGRMVPVLLKPSMVSAMELLAEMRNSCGVPGNNPFMFGRPYAMSAYKGGECIKKFASECGARDPEVLTSTKLRKHMATMSQILNLDENEADQLADFLGHDIRVHRQFYRLPQGTLQLAKMSKVLIAMESGNLSQYKGMALDNIEIDPDERLEPTPDEQVSSDEDENGEDITEPVCMEQETHLGDASTSISPKKNTSCKSMNRRKWTETEIKAVEKHMLHFILRCKLPQKKDCLECIQAEKKALSSRAWTGIKDYVRNRITALKRQASSSRGRVSEKQKEEEEAAQKDLESVLLLS